MIRIGCFIVIAGLAGSALASDTASEVPPSGPDWLRKGAAEPVERLVREGRTCYLETTTQRMVESCLEGRTYYVPVNDTTRVKVKCPRK